ncbi:hypothetical protein Ndes2437B_g06779 [Nannochloris sp. 'desiccata']
MRVADLEKAAPRQIIAAQLQASNSNGQSAACVCVGEEIETFDENTLRGHGTQVVEDRLQATVCGVVDRVNKLVTVRPLHRRYVAEIGDVVVGRVTEVVAKRWRIDLQSRQEAHLLLSAVSLPGGVQRRRTQEDELNMRSVFKEGDLVSAEVQAIHHDGTVMLHTRSSKYGLLSQGRVVRVPAELVRRQRHHFQQLENVDVDIILGCNGLVWITHHVLDEQEQQQEQQKLNDGDLDNLKKERPEPNAQQRQAVARVAQSVIALAQLGLVLQGNTISRVVHLSLERHVEPKSILEPEFLSEIVAEEEKLRQEGEEAELAT